MAFVEVPLLMHDKEEDIAPYVPQPWTEQNDEAIAEAVPQNAPGTCSSKRQMRAGGGESDSQIKRRRLSEIMEVAESPERPDKSSMDTSVPNAAEEAEMDEKSTVASLVRSPPRRATRKLKRVQLTEILSSCQLQQRQTEGSDVAISSTTEVEQEATVEATAVARRPRRKRISDFQLEAQPQRLKTVQKTKQKSVKFLLNSAIETDHARCINSQELVASPESSEDWREIQVNLICPTELIGRRCKVLWPKDNKWYCGTIHDYRSASEKHLIDYDDNDKEWILLTKHSVQFRMGVEEETHLRSSSSSEKCTIQPDADELFTLAHDLDTEQNSPGSVVWAKVKGWPMWPALVMDEEHAVKCGLASRKTSLAVQFFGSTDFARLHPSKLVAFAKGVLRKLHTKCKRAAFDQALKEVERYLKEGKLPDKMADSVESWSQCAHQKSAAEDFIGDERTCPITASVEKLPQCPLDLGDLRILNLGSIVTDSETFHNKKYIWPAGYTSVRKFPSVIDANNVVDYRMEIIRTQAAPSTPIFRVTPSDTEAFEERTANECWRKIYLKLDATLQCPREPGVSMFGFNNSRVSKLIQSLPNASACSKYAGWQDGLSKLYRPIDIQWKHLERCNVCYDEEEYVDNLFLQCAKCRMMVHMACYGESEAPNGELWLCQLCKQKQGPACCLCPITGGAMKRTTDDRWAHLTCATWIPETCLVDVKRMEPIGGVGSIRKERWRLLCSICEVPYGACIQCAHLQCRVSYHPLCARAAGFRMEYREDGPGRELQLLSFCQKHGHVLQAGEKAEVVTPQKSTHSGCSRCEPYHLNSRRGRQEPEAQALATAKRLFVENTPYVVSGFNGNPSQWRLEKTGNVYRSICATPRMDRGEPVFSLSTRFEFMRTSLHQRLCFGKSKIHGWGIFTKQKHQAGDIVAEYVGEILRSIVADMREKRHYDSIVGAGTYIFRIDEQRVVDATRAGSIAHLINHSCEPNCHSRIITVEGIDHITICAKRDILAGEELTYDYRFTSQGEELNCNCGSRSCRGSVRRRTDERETAFL